MNRKEYEQMESRYAKANWILLAIVIVSLTALGFFITSLK